MKLRIIIAFMLLLAVGASAQWLGVVGSKTVAAAPTWVETNSSHASSAGASNSLASSAFGSALTNPSIIACGVSWTVSGFTVTVSDTAGNTWVDSGAGVALSNGSTAYQQVFYALNTHTTASDGATENGRAP